jgi:hypothetical protein
VIHALRALNDPQPANIIKREAPIKKPRNARTAVSSPLEPGLLLGMGTIKPLTGIVGNSYILPARTLCALDEIVRGSIAMRLKVFLAISCLPMLAVFLWSCLPQPTSLPPQKVDKTLSGFSYYEQEQASWCGIACMDMVASYYYPSWNDFFSFYYAGDQYLSGGVGSGDGTPPGTGQEYIANITQTTATGVGMYVYLGKFFLVNYAISNQASAWDYCQLASADDVNNYIYYSIGDYAPITYRVNTWYLGNGWPDANSNSSPTQQYIHYVVGYGYLHMDPNSYNNDEAEVEYHDPFAGSTAIPDAGGPARAVTINDLTDALLYSNPGGSSGPPYAIDYSGGYIIYNKTAVSGSAVTANIASLQKAASSGASSRAAQQSLYKLPASMLSSTRLMNPPTIGVQTPTRPTKVAAKTRKGYNGSPGRH